VTAAASPCALGAGAVAMADWGADFVVTSGYKWLCGHGGVALFAVGDDLLDSIPPHPGWMGTPNPFAFDATRREQAPGARRFEQSTIAYASALGLTESWLASVPLFGRRFTEITES
jgi:cysteine desulfurase / selenocysteine lyase